MKVLLTGGGSGGHITPVLSVAHELKHKQPGISLIYAIGSGDKLVHLPNDDSAIDRVISIRSGKFRRYHGEGIKQLLDIVTLAKNIRDFFYVCIGIVQSYNMLRRERPDAIFIKGGFVAVPVGLAAAMLRIPYITHDSDAIPGLANRIIARWASIHAVAMPIENYSYPAAKTRHVGVPFNSKYHKVSRKQQLDFIKELNLNDKSKVLLVTGGGLGANRLNRSIPRIARKLIGKRPDLTILHIVGPGHTQEVQEQYDNALHGETRQVIVKDFVKDMYRYSGAADVIVARAGASSMAEFAAQQKACIIVPNPQLTGGHQLKNADVLARSGAIKQVSDSSIQKNPELLLKEIEILLDSVQERAKLAVSLYEFADDRAANKLADMIVQIARKTMHGDIQQESNRRQK